MKLFTRSLLLPLSIALCFNLNAEEPERGRLPDGRAFRTDQTGTQLVDYIAELELNVESLKRQVVGLEDEVTAKQTMIDRLNRGETLQGNLEERDLVADQAADRSAVVPAALLTQIKVGLTEQIERQATENRELRTQILSLQNQLGASAQSASGISAAGTLSLTDLRKQLQTAESDLQVERQMSSQELKSMRAELEQAREKIAKLNLQNQEVSAKLEQNNKQFERLLEQRERAETLENVRPVVSKALPTEHQTTDPDQHNRASYSPARSRAVESIQGAVMTELNKLNALISSRDRLLRQYESQARSVTIKPASTISSRGMSVPQIRNETQKADSIYALNYLRQDINQIRARVQDDITLIQRMIK